MHEAISGLLRRFPAGKHAELVASLKVPLAKRVRELLQASYGDLTETHVEATVRE